MPAADPSLCTAAAHEAPASAIAVAQKLGASGDALAAAARDAFMVGSRYAMWIGAMLLVVGAVFVAVRGQQQVAPAEAETLEDDPAAFDREQFIEFHPVLTFPENATRVEEVVA